MAADRARRSGHRHRRPSIRRESLPFADAAAELAGRMTAGDPLVPRRHTQSVMPRIPRSCEAALLRRVRAQFRLDVHGIHGLAHWARVHFHGNRLALELGLDPSVPRLFAILHDSQRRNDDADPEHGLRAADYAWWLWRKGHFELDAADMRRLALACEAHSDGEVEAEPLIQVCWDADRLDLGRVGIRPDPRGLCTAPAKDPARIEQAWRWSQRGPLSAVE